MSKVVIYTAIAGSDSDDLREVEKAPGVHYVCFTDQPFKSKAWDIRPFTFADECPVLTAKYVRVFPHEYFPEFDLSVWLDGSLKPLPSIAGAAEKALARHDMALHEHSRCFDIYDELNLLLYLDRWPAEPLKRHFRRYEKECVPKDKHWETGLLFRRHNAPLVIETMKTWWAEILKYRHFRDQVSFFYSAWKTGLKVNTLAGNLRRTPHAKFFHHKRQPPPPPSAPATKDKRRKITKADLKNKRTLMRYFRGA